MSYCKQILVIEDDEDIREMIVDLLADEGYSSDSARNGKEGLDKLQKMPVPSLVLLDLMMPAMNGWEFLNAKKRDPNLSQHKVVVISAVMLNNSYLEKGSYTADGTIRKPIYLDHLWQEVRKFCGPANAVSAAS